MTETASNTTTTSDRAELGKVLVIVPTYNEAENIRPIVQRLRAAVPDADVLIADDNSPDGTGRIADELAAADDHVQVMHRQAKEGLGATYLAGFNWGLERGYGVLVEHDADGSHQPEQLPSLLRALRFADMVKGSRWVKGGSVKNWPWHREALSRGGSLWSRMLLGLPIKDVTGGFTAFRADTLRGLGLDDIESAGYAFQVDLARRAIAAGYTVTEVPIEFIERERGDSKMSGRIVAEAMLLTTRWGLAKRTNQVKDYLGFAKDNAAKLAGEVGEKVGPEVEKYAAQTAKVAGEVSDKLTAEAQRLSREVSRLAAEAAEKFGPEVEKYAQAASRAVADLSSRIRTFGAEVTDSSVRGGASPNGAAGGASSAEAMRTDPSMGADVATVPDGSTGADGTAPEHPGVDQRTERQGAGT